jgi:hypothetical protein
MCQIHVNQSVAELGLSAVTRPKAYDPNYEIKAGTTLQKQYTENTCEEI